MLEDILLSCGAGGPDLFGDGTYSGNISGSGVTVTGNNVTVTGAATVAPDGTTGASVVMCDTLTLDGASASLSPSTNSKGLIIFARSGVILKNGAKLNIDKKGKAGNFGNLTAYDLAPASLKAKLSSALHSAYVVQGEGAAGGAQTASGAAGNDGSAAGAMQTGGGGSGAQYVGSYSGRGGKGGPCCGGAGSGGSVNGNGGVCQSYSFAAGDYGGPGSDSWDRSGSGAGDPVGVARNCGAGAGPTAEGAGGGLLEVFAPVVSIGSGCIVSSDGAMGGTGGVSYAGGGSAGGGCVVIVTKTGGYTNSGTVRALGGSRTSAPYEGSHTGGAGGNGSVNLFAV